MRDKALIGAAGEYLVLSRLLARGFLAAPAPRGTRKVDVLVNFLDGGNPCLMQVKTSTVGASWVMNEKHEGIHDEDLFYCFVDLKPVDSSVHVVPALVVAKALTEGHAKWLATPGRDGREHRATAMRQIRPNNPVMPPNWMDPYLENWGQLASRGH